jgi:hypothetical protein
MSDGVSTKYGLTIGTDNYSVSEVVINILIIRYDLNYSIYYCKGLPRIYIKASSLNKLRTIIIPHIIPFSLYKLQKGKRNNIL